MTPVRAKARIHQLVAARDPRIVDLVGDIGETRWAKAAEEGADLVRRLMWCGLKPEQVTDDLLCAAVATRALLGGAN